MRPSDVLELVALVHERWLNFKPTTEQQRSYAEHLGPLDAAQVRAAIESIALDGQEWAPTSGEVVRRVAELQLGAPDWSEVKRELVARHLERERSADQPFEWTCPYGLCDNSGIIVNVEKNEGSHCRCRPERLAAKRSESALHPLIREFINDGYVTWGEVERVATGESTVEAQMRDKWREFAARAVQDRTLAAIEAPAALRRISAAKRDDGRRGGGLSGLSADRLLAAASGDGDTQAA